MKLNHIHHTDALTGLSDLPAAVIQCCVTSPPYYGLRDYGHPDQIGLEKTPEEYVEKLVAIFRQVRRTLRDDGTLWLNIGDSYAAGKIGRDDTDAAGRERLSQHGHAGHANKVITDHQKMQTRKPATGLKPKDLIGIPWLLAFALRADGWYLRQDIIWHKPNPMPESVTDRCTKAHEYIFLLTKSEKYYYNADAIAEPKAPATTNDKRTNQNGQRRHRDFPGSASNGGTNLGGSDGNRNRRSVWTIATRPYPEAHFATYPPQLITPCILAGSREGDIILDPFIGSGTTGEVALRLQRHYIGYDIQPQYIQLAQKRTQRHHNLFTPQF